jgi:hypothetical protein
VWSKDIAAAIDEVNGKLLASSGPNVTVVDCGPILTAGGRLRHGYARDTLHLTSAAYETLNQHLEPVLQRLAQDAQAKGTDALQ